MKQFILVLIMSGLVLKSFTCEIIMINDSSRPIIISELQTKKSYSIDVGERNKIGDPSVHAHVMVYFDTPEVVDKRMAAPAYEFEMTSCSATKKPVVVKMSELQNNAISPLFSMKDYTKKSSEMNRKVESAEKKEHSCGCNGAKKASSDE